MDLPEQSYCGRCGYPLGGLDEPRCPGCKRGFDPLDPGTYSRSPQPSLSIPWKVTIAAFLYPILPLAMFTIAMLGEWTAADGMRIGPGAASEGSNWPGIFRRIAEFLQRGILGAMTVSFFAICAIPHAALPGRRLRDLACGAMLLILVWSAWFACFAF